MAFDQSTISDVNPYRSGADLVVSWTSTAAEGTAFQVYVNNVLTWSGTARAAHLPWPAGRNTRISVGTVAAGEEETDFAADLPALAPTSKLIAWEGGTFLASDIAGFHIYMSSTAGGAVDYDTVVATLPAYPGGVLADGYGMGGYGRGGYGRSASTYSWPTPSLGNGDWIVAVRPFDNAGNEPASPTTVTVTIDAPPRPPAADSLGRRLSYTYNATTHVATLSWLASPA